MTKMTEQVDLIKEVLESRGIRDEVIQVVELSYLLRQAKDQLLIAMNPPEPHSAILGDEQGLLPAIDRALEI